MHPSKEDLELYHIMENLNKYIQNNFNKNAQSAIFRRKKILSYISSRFLKNNNLKSLKNDCPLSNNMYPLFLKSYKYKNINLQKNYYSLTNKNIKNNISNNSSIFEKEENNVIKKKEYLFFLSYNLHNSDIFIESEVLYNELTQWFNPFKNSNPFKYYIDQEVDNYYKYNINKNTDKMSFFLLTKLLIKSTLNYIKNKIPFIKIYFLYIKNKFILYFKAFDINNTFVILKQFYFIFCFKRLVGWTNLFHHLVYKFFVEQI